jgi:hypothetical protein
MMGVAVCCAATSTEHRDAETGSENDDERENARPSVVLAH